MTSPMDGSREIQRRKRWEREHIRMHERDTENSKGIIRELEGRVRKLERSVWTMSAVLGTSTLIGIINLVQDATGVK